VLGPDDEVPVHDVTHEIQTVGRKLFTPGNIEQTEIILAVDILRAEHMPPMDTFGSGIDAFVVCKYSGV